MDISRVEEAMVNYFRYDKQLDAIDVTSTPKLAAFSVVEVEEAAQNLIARGIVIPGDDGIWADDLSWTWLRRGPNAPSFG